MSLDFVKRLHLKPKPPVNDEPQYLLSANRSKMVNLGTVDLNVAIQGLVFNFTFCVFETLSSSIIIGYDFLVNSHAQISLSQKVVTFADGLVTANLITADSKDTVLLITETVTIPPLTEAIIPVFTRRKCQNVDYVVETWPAIKNKMIAIAGALVLPINHIVPCRLVNLGLTPRTLTKNTPVAVINQINMQDEGNMQIAENTMHGRNFGINSISVDNLPPLTEQQKSLE